MEEFEVLDNTTRRRDLIMKLVSILSDELVELILSLRESGLNTNHIHEETAKLVRKMDDEKVSRLSNTLDNPTDEEISEFKDAMEIILNVR